MKKMYHTVSLFLIMSILLIPLSTGAGVEILNRKNMSLEGRPVDIAPSLNGRWIYVLTEDAKLLVYTTEGQLFGSIALGSAFDGIRAGISEESLLLINRGEKRLELVSLEFIRQIDTQGAPFKGPGDAPVEIVVFSGFQCPYCARLAPILDKIQKANDTEVKIAFKNYPLRSHRYSFMSAAAALAAHEQGKFWEFHDRLFKNVNTVNPQRIQQITIELGLDFEKFNKDVKSPAIRNRISKDLQDAGGVGIKGTPTVYVNGRRARDVSLPGLKALVDAELIKAKAIPQRAGGQGVGQ